MTPTGHLDTEACYRAVSSRDRRFDGVFYTAVRTTGIYCRPSCPARTPAPGNVTFHPTAASAHAAGFRACKRCDPKGERAAIHAAAIRAACDLIEASEATPSLATLAERAGYARHHFLRLFKEITGVTPHSYAASVRARRLQASLAAGDRVAEAVAGADPATDRLARRRVLLDLPASW